MRRFALPGCGLVGPVLTYAAQRQRVSMRSVVAEGMPGPQPLASASLWPTVTPLGRQHSRVRA
jgi:hypothetical protein